MARARGADIGLGRPQLEFLGLQCRIVGDGGFDPLLDTGGFGQRRLEVFRQSPDVGDRLAGEFAQGLVAILDGIAREDGVGARAVVLGAGFVHVGDRRQADFQALGREVELLLQRRLGGLGGGERFQLHQHFEVGGRGARDQGVVGRIQAEVGGLAQRIGALQAREVAVVVDHLAQVDAEVPRRGLRLAPADEDVVGRGRIVVGIDRAFAGIGAAATAQRCIRPDLRQQRRARLHRTLAGDEAAGFCGGELRVA